MKFLVNYEYVHYFIFNNLKYLFVLQVIPLLTEFIKTVELSHNS